MLTSTGYGHGSGTLPSRFRGSVNGWPGPVGGALCWVEARNWDLDQHFTHVRLPSPGAMRQLLDVAGAQAGEAFDRARPLWHLTLVDGLDGEGSALVVKMHHSMTDGVGGIGLMWLFTDREPHPRSSVDLRARARPTTKRDRPNGLSTAASSILGSAITDPFGALRSVPKAARSTVKILAPATQSLSPLTTGRGLDRHLDVLDVPLRDLERAGHAVDGTVNDAFMAAVVGGLRRYHAAHGETPTELRVTMPINVRRDDDDPGGNRFTPARFAVSLAIDDPAQRMEELGRIARQWRHEPAVGMTDVLATALSHLPDAVTTSVLGSMLKGVDFVATNVPGSRQRCWLAGAEVLNFYGFGPPSGSALSVALVSHLDSCCIGVNVDTAAIDDPDVLRTSLEQGFAEVVAVGRSGRRRRRKPSSTVPVTDRAAATRPAPRRLSALDASFLEAETPATPMHIGALMLLEGDPLRDGRGELRMDEIRAEIAAQLPRSPRMRQLAVQVPFARPVWEAAPSFDITHHVRKVRVPPPGTRAQLEALCCELQMKLLDRTRPLWEMWFVDGLDGRVRRPRVQGPPRRRRRCVSGRDVRGAARRRSPARGEPIRSAPDGESAATVRRRRRRERGRDRPTVVGNRRQPGEEPQQGAGDPGRARPARPTHGNRAAHEPPPTDRRPSPTRARALRPRPAQGRRPPIRRDCQ